MSDKKKINILMISSSSSLGGGTKHMFLLGSNLSRQFKIFYAIPHNSNFIKYLNSENHIEISERRLSLKDIIKLKKFIKLKSIDIIHSHGKGAGAIGRFLRLLVNKPLIYTFHGIHLKCHNWNGRLGYLIYEFLLGWIDSKKIFVSNSEKKYAIKSKIYLGHKSLIINNGVSNKYLKELENTNYKNDKIFKFSKITVLTICRFVDQKNVKEILKIAFHLSNINFYIIGNGPLWKEINYLILKNNLKNVFLPGEKKDIFKYLYSSDIYLSTSLYEGLPISILEAMSIGLPIIASDVMGNCDTIVSGQSGYLYKLNDVKDAVKKINKLSKSYYLRKRLGNAAFERQRYLFSKEIMIKKYTNLYRNLFKLEV